MSAAIKKALDNLDRAIDRVEAAATKRPKAAKPGTPQPDLFAAPTVNVIGFDRNALARKLDVTIAKVEQLLSEG